MNVEVNVEGLEGCENENRADLGRYALFFWVGMQYGCARREEIGEGSRDVFPMGSEGG